MVDCTLKGIIIVYLYVYLRIFTYHITIVRLNLIYMIQLHTTGSKPIT